MRKKDIELLLWIQKKLRNETLNKLFIFLSSIGNYWVWLLINALLILNPTTRLIGQKTMSAIGIEAILVHSILKRITNRPRPFDVSTEIIPLGRNPER